MQKLNRLEIMNQPLKTLNSRKIIIALKVDVAFFAIGCAVSIYTQPVIATVLISSRENQSRATTYASFA